MSVRDRVGKYRQRMRARGYRAVQVWVPDVRTEEFAREARRQAALVAQSDTRDDDQDFIEAVSVKWDDE
jgi:ABC-type branched-subunit amino acid transport system substrate-binding protein